MSVGAADAERADPCSARAFDHPGRSFAAEQERATLNVERGIDAFEIDQRWYGVALQDEKRLDQTGDAGGGVQVAKIGLNGAEAAEADVARINAKGPLQSRNLDWIAERRARAVGLDVADAARRRGGERERGNDGLYLSVDARCSEAGFRRAIVPAAG